MTDYIELRRLAEDAEVSGDDLQMAPFGVIGILDEVERLKAEVEALRSSLADCSASLHAEMIQKFHGELPEDMHPVTRREYDRDMAELAGYRAVLAKETGQ
jgi:hypothetical protein